jgi:hypothetical protein
MKEKNIAVVLKMLPEKWKQVEDFLDSVGATVIFVKQADANRKLVVKNLPEWKEERKDYASSTKANHGSRYGFFLEFLARAFWWIHVPRHCEQQGFSRYVNGRYCIGSWTGFHQYSLRSFRLYTFA